VLPLGFSETIQIDQRKNPEKPRQSKINFNTITNLNKFKVYTSTVLLSVIVNFSAVSGFQFINNQHSMSFVLNVVLMWSRISCNNVLLSDLQPCCSMASMCSRRRLFSLFGKYSIQECFAQQLVSRYVSAGSQCHNENAEVVRNEWNDSKINITTTAVSVPWNLLSSAKLVIECGELPQCLRNPDFVRFSQKYLENQTTPKNPDLVGKKTISGANVKPMANRGLHISGSNGVKKVKFGRPTWIDMICFVSPDTLQPV